MNIEKFNITKENIKDLDFFNTTKDIRFQDGSKIKKGSEFIIDIYMKNGQFQIHFGVDENNFYANGLGDEYIVSLNELQEFAEPTRLSIESYLNKNKEHKNNLKDDKNYNEDCGESYDKYLENLLIKAEDENSYKSYFENIKNTEKTLMVFTEEYKKPILINVKETIIEFQKPNTISGLYKKEEMAFNKAINKINSYKVIGIDIKENKKTLENSRVLCR